MDKKTEKKIAKLKKEAKKYYLNYHGLADDYSCGLTLAEFMSSDIAHNKLEFNRIMDELAVIDPATPKARL